MGNRECRQSSVETQLASLLVWLLEKHIIPSRINGHRDFGFFFLSRRRYTQSFISSTETATMKLVSSIAFALFVTSAEAFGPAAPVNGNAFGLSSTNSGGMTMRTSVYDMTRKQKFNKVLKKVGASSKEAVETQLLTPEVSSLIEKSNWKLRKSMLRHVRNQANKFDITVDATFGVP